MKRILIVDDEALFLQGLSKALKTDETEVTTVETGTAALMEIADSSYQLCFLDVFLPDINGVELLKKIKSISPKTRVILMSAGIITGTMRETIENDAYLFIPKPFELFQIKMLAKRVLEETH